MSCLNRVARSCTRETAESMQQIGSIGNPAHVLQRLVFERSIASRKCQQQTARIEHGKQCVPKRRHLQREWIVGFVTQPADGPEQDGSHNAKHLGEIMICGVRMSNAEKTPKASASDRHGIST